MNEKKIHPLVPEMKSELEQGRITRREFLRLQRCSVFRLLPLASLLAALHRKPVQRSHLP